jgi:hypothetical protein
MQKFTTKGQDFQHLLIQQGTSYEGKQYIEFSSEIFKRQRRERSRKIVRNDAV